MDEGTRYVAMLEEQVTRYRITTWGPIALFYKGALACARGAARTGGIADLEQAIVDLRATYRGARMPLHLAILANEYEKCGRLLDAEKTIAEALSCPQAEAERWCRPEVLRIHARILTAREQTDQAEEALLESMALAQETDTLSWKLRSACDLARL